MNEAVFLAVCQALKKGEGVVDWMYLDMVGLVTVGVGFLLKEEGDVDKLKWVRDGGGPASSADAHARWRELNSIGQAVREGRASAGTHSAYKDPGGVRLNMAGVLETKVRGKYATLKTWPEFRNFDDFPPDAQMAILIRAWGPFDYIRCPKFIAACGRRDWEIARQEIPYGAVKQVDANRNPSMQQMMENAVAQEYERRSLGKAYPSGPIYPRRMISAAGQAVRESLISNVLQQQNWSQVYRLLNGLSMREMLATLDETSNTQLSGIARNLATFGGPYNPARIRFALDTIKNRSVPSNPPPDVAQYGQDREAAEYLKQHKGQPKSIEF